MFDFRHATDPFYEILEEGDRYNLVGIINSKVEVKQTDEGFLLFRVALQLGCDENFSQAIIEVWSKVGEEEPIFTRKWEHFQLAYFRQVLFIGKRNNHGLEFYKFELPADRDVPRYIWLSSDEPDFWARPVIETESNSISLRTNWIQTRATGQRCPFDGVLKSSKGSVFEAGYTEEDRTIHTQTLIGNYTFSSFYETVRKMRNELITDACQTLFADKEAFFKITGGPFYMHM